MKHVLTILLLMLALPLWGEEAGRARVAPAPIELGEKLMLYSYTYLGVEVRALTDEEFDGLYEKLKAPAQGNGPICLSMEIGVRASFSPYMKRKVGLVITHVVPGSPAEKAGLEVGDIIHDIGAAEMRNPANLLSVMRNIGPGVPMHMYLIDKNLCWKLGRPRCTERPEPALVGHIVPLKLCPKHRLEMERHRARAIELMTQDDVPIVELCMHLESIGRLLCKGYTPGCLRIPLRSGECTITVTRNWFDVDVIMTENGVETKARLKRWIVTPPKGEKQPAHVEDGPRVLPDAIRQRLREIDTSGAAEAPIYPPNGTGCPIPGACCR